MSTIHPYKFCMYIYIPHTHTPYMYIHVCMYVHVRIYAYAQHRQRQCVGAYVPTHRCMCAWAPCTYMCEVIYMRVFVAHTPGEADKCSVQSESKLYTRCNRHTFADPSRHRSLLDNSCGSTHATLYIYNLYISDIYKRRKNRIYLNMYNKWSVKHIRWTCELEKNK